MYMYKEKQELSLPEVEINSARAQTPKQQKGVYLARGELSKAINEDKMDLNYVSKRKPDPI